MPTQPSRAGQGTSGSEEQRERRLCQDFCHVVQEPGPRFAVDDPVVERDGHGGDPAGNHLFHTVVRDHPGPSFDGTHAEDRRFVAVDYWGSRVDAEDADVGDGERAVAVVGGLQPPLTGDRNELVDA